MIIPIIVAYITACLVGMYFVYWDWLNTPPDGWPEKPRTTERNPCEHRLELISQQFGARPASSLLWVCASATAWRKP
jgi:hypothetical protein